MNRRTAVGRLGAAAVAGLAGCGALPGRDEPNRVGEAFLVGGDRRRMEYVVRRVQTFTRLGNGPTATTAGVWVVLTIRLVNRAPRPLELTSRPFTLVRDDGREFSPVNGIGPYVSNDARVQPRSFAFLTLAPDSPTDVAVVFEVSPEDRYTLRIRPLGTFTLESAGEVALGEVADPADGRETAGDDTATDGGESTETPTPETETASTDG
ncbi:DUF4352 domain-containing protein [Halobaculum sp. MBLA0143]|uniref:DUF4352 domain-containing protein n=1 Tax=Halobaculum sp. MBLA0143 TaxID=3079933 RepID=UPI0035254E91